MKTKLYYLLIFALTFSYSLLAQQKATLVVKAEYVIDVPSIASQIASGDFIPAPDISKEYNPKRRGSNKAVPGKGLPKGNDPLWEKQKSSMNYKSTGPILTFQAASANSTPTDPTGAVGPDHFVNSWNSSFRIWDKEGNPLTSPASLGTIFPGETAGDPIVMYDQFADRFVVTEFTFQNGFLVAVSQGPDPVNSGWYTYFFPTNSFPDYPKFSLWSDGYYITSNKNSSTAGFSEVVYAIERDKILVGDPNAQMVGFPLPTIVTSGFFSPLGFNVNGPEMPPPGNAPIVYMQDDSWSQVSVDHLKIWSINVDWENPNNSTISDPQIIETTPFDGLFDGGSFSNLPQPQGPDIDALQATIMYMAQYRRFSEHNAVVFNFVVDLDGGDDYSGIRWYELRQNNDDDPWEIYQEGTYAQPEGHSAFSGNMCIDANGNIALAYTIVSNSMYPSLRYTGRFSTDPLNVMTIEENSIAEGTTYDPSFRYGDYSQMTIDPVDDLTFWSIGEYFNGGPRKNQVGVFRIAPELANDVGIVSIDEPVNGLLTANEDVTVTIRNFGVDNQDDIPVYFQINDGEIIEEVFSGTIPANTNVQYTFTATGDFSTPGETYTLFASTVLDTDENLENDTLSAMISHLYADDMGVTAVSSPVSGSDLTDEEEISVTIENFGALTQEDFDVYYVLNGNPAVTEQVDGPLTSESSMEYTFNTPGDFSAVMNHELTVSTSLEGDADPSNDSTSVIISHTLCQPVTDCSQGVGIYSLQLGNIDNVSGCDPNGYGNYTTLSTLLDQGSENELTISCEYGSTVVKVWIDFNDNFVFEPEEVVVDDYEIADGQQAGNFTETMPLVIPEDANLGEHLMRVKTNYNSSVPEDACEATMFGETEDYTVVIDEATGIGYQQIETNDMVLINTGNNQYELSFEAREIKETLIITIHDISGRTLIHNRVSNLNGKYEFDFDMSYAEKGIYLLRLGSNNFGKIKRFYVD